MNIQTSANFKRQAVNAVVAIFFFVITYLLLIVGALALTAGFGYAAFMLLVFKPAIYTLMAAIGLFGMGVFIVIFLFKFVTKKHKVDESHLVEITAEDEPKLFALINEVVSEVKTTFPKKVYLSHDVNASVFYNSTFWSMFFPVRKNLQIGTGLINSVSVTEFKAILAHEFGHFSQRSMKVGSYVYNVNQVIYNLLFENESYNSLLSNWANASGYFTLFAKLASKIIEGVQWILRKVYETVNLSYMSLSREMEFHADEVAANVTGKSPMISALLRLGLADLSFNSVINYYNERIPKSIKTSNIYNQHAWLMQFLAAENKITVNGILPDVKADDLSRFNKSKLVIKDQWSSHPTTAERVKYLESLNVPARENDPTLASVLFTDKEYIESKLTEQLFAQIEYKDVAQIQGTHEFQAEYKQQFRNNGFDELYNGYYDNKYTGLDDDFYANAYKADNVDVPNIFTSEAVDMVYTANSLESDIETIRGISNGNIKLKTFDYNGQRYHQNDCNDLLMQLEAELVVLKDRISEFDRRVCQLFLFTATEQGKATELLGRVEAFNRVYGDYQRRFDLYGKMVSHSSFMQETTSFKTIETKLSTLYETEMEFKKEIKMLLEDTDHDPDITSEMRHTFRVYCFNGLKYFTHPDYDEYGVGVLYETINNYLKLINETVFNMKKRLLDYQADLIKN